MWLAKNVDTLSGFHHGPPFTWPLNFIQYRLKCIENGMEMFECCWKNWYSRIYFVALSIYFINFTGDDDWNLILSPWSIFCLDTFSQTIIEKTNSEKTKFNGILCSMPKHIRFISVFVYSIWTNFILWFNKKGDKREKYWVHVTNFWRNSNGTEV